MTYRDSVLAPPPAVPQGPTCPHCGTRLAERAAVCFMCGAVMQTARRRRRQIPWLDLALLVVIVAAIAFWWIRLTPTADPIEVSSAAPLPITEIARIQAPTLTPTSTTPTPTLLPATSTPSPTPAFITYKVVAGDTLSGISARFGVAVDAILKANKLQVSARLAVGQALILPTAGMKVEALTANGTPAPTATPDNATLMYRVKAGDTLSGIALQYKATVSAILEANKLKADAILRIGQVLIIPRGTPMPTSTPTVAASPTSTAGPPLPAPVLLGPADGAILAATEPVVLRWAAVGTLGEEDWYVVHVWSLAPGGPDLEQQVKGTSLRLEATLRLSDYVAARGWRWRVIVARHFGHAADPEPLLTAQPGPTPTATALPDPARLLLLSPPSEVRSFAWN
ncbi:MAG: LysM peptidoglycan-binding domain-containing protein [Anaerolineae bacterium]